MMDNLFFKRSQIRRRPSNKLLFRAILFSLGLISFVGCKKDFDARPASSSSGLADARIAGKPNIILFIANDFGFELPTYNEGQSYSTPNLDFLAANGVYFKQAYNHPDGSPS